MFITSGIWLIRTSSSSQSTLDGVDQGVCSLATESATEVIQIQTPHHGSTKTTLLQPVNLWMRGETKCEPQPEIQKLLNLNSDI